jgi:predicted nucleotidyltransferase
LNSSVLKWPDKKSVEKALEKWVRETAARHEEILQIGCIGSFSRDDWGVGSDLDLIIVIKESTLPFHERASQWDLTAFPVPVDLQVYTLSEWMEIEKRGGRFWKTIRKEGRWLYDKNI